MRPHADRCGLCNHRQRRMQRGRRSGQRSSSAALTCSQTPRCACSACTWHSPPMLAAHGYALRATQRQRGGPRVMGHDETLTIPTTTTTHALGVVPRARREAWEVEQRRGGPVRSRRVAHARLCNDPNNTELSETHGVYRCTAGPSVTTTCVVPTYAHYVGHYTLSHGDTRAQRRRAPTPHARCGTT